MADLTKELNIIIKSFADLKAFKDLSKVIKSTTTGMVQGSKGMDKLKRSITQIGGTVSKTGKSFKFAGDKGFKPLIKDGKLLEKSIGYTF